MYQIQVYFDKSNQIDRATMTKNGVMVEDWGMNEESNYYTIDGTHCDRMYSMFFSLVSGAINEREQLHRGYRR